VRGSGCDIVMQASAVACRTLCGLVSYIRQEHLMHIRQLVASAALLGRGMVLFFADRVPICANPLFDNSLQAITLTRKIIA